MTGDKTLRAHRLARHPQCHPAPERTICAHRLTYAYCFSRHSYSALGAAFARLFLLTVRDQPRAGAERADPPFGAARPLSIAFPVAMLNRSIRVSAKPVRVTEAVACITWHPCALCCA